MNKRIILAVLIAASACVLLSGQAVITPRTFERPFFSGGHVWMKLTAGDYRLSAGRDDRVRVELTTSDPDDIASCTATIERKGSDLLVATNGPRGGMRVTIELPARTDLNVRLSAGDLRMRGIRGSKDISSWAGDIDVEVGSPDDYRSVHASVTAGDLKAKPFDIMKDGLFRSFSWRGKGAFKLDARLTAGNITLR